MIQIPITGVNALLTALHAASAEGLLFAVQSLVDYQPYLLIYFH